MTQPDKTERTEREKLVCGIRNALRYAEEHGLDETTTAVLIADHPAVKARAALPVAMPEREPAINGPYATTADLAREMGSDNPEADERGLNAVLRRQAMVDSAMPDREEDSHKIMDAVDSIEAWKRNPQTTWTPANILHEHADLIVRTLLASLTHPQPDEAIECVRALREALQVAATAEVYMPEYGVIDADMVQLIQSEASKGLDLANRFLEGQGA